MMAKAMRDVELHYLIVQFLIIRISSRGVGTTQQNIFFDKNCRIFYSNFGFGNLK